MIPGGLGLTSSCGPANRLWRTRGTHQLNRRWPYLLGFIIVIYAAQILTGLLVSPGGVADMAHGRRDPLLQAGGLPRDAVRVRRVTLKPFGFFDRNPAIDLAPSGGDHCHT